ncbi:MAG: hypothetical protein KAJ19_08820 [Gammaproteobacteria bacterium]|nr:hypothetical protein [Gammaproteobacteria bacterium]
MKATINLDVTEHRDGKKFVMGADIVFYEMNAWDEYQEKGSMRVTFVDVLLESQKLELDYDTLVEMIENGQS